PTGTSPNGQAAAPPPPAAPAAPEPPLLDPQLVGPNFLSDAPTVPPTPTRPAASPVATVEAPTAPTRVLPVPVARIRPELRLADEPKRRPLPPLIHDVAEVARLTARLRSLCRLVVRDRRPLCPINGVLVLVPYAATAADDDASQAAAIC